MKKMSLKLSLIKRLGLMLSCGGLALGSVQVDGGDTLPINVAALWANAGNTFVLTPTPNPSVFKITADGVVQVSVMGNCSEHAELLVQFPASAGQPILLTGTGTLTSSDGATTLNFSSNGTATPDPANPAFFNNSYRVTFTGGTGAFASARGVAQINELVKFSSQTTGTGTWTMKGFVITPPVGN